MATFIQETLGPEYLKPDWEKYKGSNHHHLPRSSTGLRCFGGGISFRLGQPLNQELWDDLVYRLRIERLWVIPYNGCQWCIEPMPRGVIISLDEQGNVSGISLHGF